MACVGVPLHCQQRRGRPQRVEPDKLVVADEVEDVDMVVVALGQQVCAVRGPVNAQRQCCPMLVPEGTQAPTRRSSAKSTDPPAPMSRTTERWTHLALETPREHWQIGSRAGQAMPSVSPRRPCRQRPRRLCVGGRASAPTRCCSRPRNHHDGACRPVHTMCMLSRQPMLTREGCPGQLRTHEWQGPRYEWGALPAPAATRRSPK